jgi:hypothetical protein
MLVSEIEQRAASKSLHKTMSDLKLFSILGVLPVATGLRKELYEVLETVISERYRKAYEEGRRDERRSKKPS